MSITEDFKAALEPQLYELEPGIKAKLRRVGVMDLIQQGHIPDSLSGMASEIASNPSRILDEDELRRYAGVVDAVCCAAFVEPVVTQDGAGDSMKVSDIPYAWRAKVYTWASSSPGVLRLHKFRDEQAGNVEVTQLGEMLRQVASRNVGA